MDEERLKDIEDRLLNLELSLLHFAAAISEHHEKLAAVGETIESINAAVQAERMRLAGGKQPQAWRKAG